MIFKKKRLDKDMPLPRHIGIIMDGNGRWARKRGLPRQAGHPVGAETFRTISTYCKNIGIKYLTVYAFSTENWKRPAEEVEAINGLLKKYLLEAREKLVNEDIVLNFLGDTSVYSDELKELIYETSQMNNDHCKLICNIAINYGGRAEIVHAVNKLIKQGAESVTEEDISGALYTAGQPEPDLIIRTGGEYRTSNFLMWQGAYSELYFTPTLWPDFKTTDIDKAIEEFNKRNRRYGGV